MTTDDFDPRGPSPDGSLLTPIDPIDAFFKAAQEAILRGDDQVEVGPECHEFADALQRMIRFGPSAMPKVRHLARLYRDRVPEIIDPDGELSDGIPLDETVGEIDTARLLRMSRATLLRLVERLMHEQEETCDAKSAAPETLASLSDDELRATARHLWPFPALASSTRA
jgi:hypothetical protein